MCRTIPLATRRSSRSSLVKNGCSQFSTRPNLAVRDAEPIRNTSRYRQQWLIEVRDCVGEKVHRWCSETYDVDLLSLQLAGKGEWCCVTARFQGSGYRTGPKPECALGQMRTGPNPACTGPECALAQMRTGPKCGPATRNKRLTDANPGKSPGHRSCDEFRCSVMDPAVTLGTGRPNTRPPSVHPTPSRSMRL